MPDSPAAGAGLLVDDVITSIDGADVSSMTALVLALRSHDPGDVVEIVLRIGKPQTCTVTAAPSKDQP